MYVDGGLRKYAKRIPINIDKAVLPIYKEAKTRNANVKLSNYCILFVK
jgi:hypothetical protein